GRRLPCGSKIAMPTFSICSISGTPAVVDPPAAAFTGLLNVLGSPRIAATSRLGPVTAGASGAEDGPELGGGAQAVEIAATIMMASSTRILHLLRGIATQRALGVRYFRRRARRG